MVYGVSMRWPWSLQVMVCGGLLLQQMLSHERSWFMGSAGGPFCPAAAHYSCRVRCAVH